MVRKLFYLLFFPLSVWVVLFSCIKKPVYPETPVIEFSSLTRYVITDPVVGNEVDSIVFTIKFKDGDGDMGLAPTEPPNSAFNYQLDNLGNPIKYNGNPAYSCDNYYINSALDTLLIIPEIHFNNYFIELLVKQTNGTFLPFNFPDCGNLMGRYPPLAPPNYKGPIEGNLSFTNMSPLRGIFENKTIKFRLKLEDRAFHMSNTVESNELLITY